MALLLAIATVSSVECQTPSRPDDPPTAEALAAGCSPPDPAYKVEIEAIAVLP